ncbi:MAG: hypothetical protein ABW046_07115 [Actinoplanes sp.]
MADVVKVGATYYVGPGCGVPWEWAPILLRVITADVDPYGTAFLTGYQIQDGRVVDKRTAVPVITAGLILVPDRAADRVRQQQLRAARNPGPRLLPRPRTTAEQTTHSGRTR